MLRTVTHIFLALMAGMAVFATPVAVCACPHHSEKQAEAVASCHGHPEPNAEPARDRVGDLRSANVRGDICVSESCTCVQASAKLLFKTESLKLKKYLPAAVPVPVEIESPVAIVSVVESFPAYRPIPLHPPPRDVSTRGPPVS
jgi:hypothetical protein